MVRIGVAQLAVLALFVGSSSPVVGGSVSDPLREGFLQPPPEARPRVWWHWMNGNVTEDGIAKDIDWMRRIGVGGLQNFDADFATPQVVDKRLVYMTPEWKRAFRFAAEQAEANGLEFAIAGSPGWSETGGPWVQPQDGIKKLSWSELVITGGRPFSGALPKPPGISGPYQTLAREGTLSAGAGDATGPQLYRDVAVLAVPLAAPPISEPEAIATDGAGRRIDGTKLHDQDLVTAIDLGAQRGNTSPMAVLRYAAPRTVRSATLFMRDAIPRFFDPRFSPVLEAQVSGRWTPVGQFALSFVPTTIAFRPVRARAFRVVFRPFAGPRRPQQMANAPGAIVPSFLAPDASPMPAKLAELTLTDTLRVDHAEAKAGYTLVNRYDALETSAGLSERGAPPNQVVNLTNRMRPDGTLDWTPPKGSWRIIRLGWSLTGQTNHPASAEATGLEVDKLDGDAVSRYLHTYLDMYRDAAGDGLLGARGVRALLLDSTEVGAFNWTPRMVERFRQLRGYDPTPWLPALTGMLIGTRAQCDRFLYDFRRTIAELHASEHYGTVARVAHEYGLTVYGEALEDQRPVLGDDMAMRAHADVPMAALWTWDSAYDPRPTLLGDMKGASSVGHLYGRNVIAAESMTSALSPWASSPADLRRVIDLEFAHGINRPVIHTSVHQPLDKKPGLSLLIFGQFFNRHESWAEMAKPWIDYISRASFLLQQGRNVADVAYFSGEEAPITALTAYGTPSDIPARYAYDYVNADALRDVLHVQDGSLVAPSGARYRVLYLAPGARAMTLPVLRRLAGLVREGATVVGDAPVGSPSLADAPAEFAALVKQLWSGKHVTPFGKGRVIAGRDVEGALASTGAVPDFDAGAAGKDLMFVHRRLDDGDLYFVVNRAREARRFDARFRVTGKAPEIWHADNGATEDVGFVRDGASTIVPLELGPEESAFILFRKDTGEIRRTVEAPTLVPFDELGSGWTVTFQPGRGAPASIALPALGSLSDQADPGVRYFSGEAVYRRRFTLPETYVAGTPLWLDLGAVGDVAEVRINGMLAGALWHAPWRLDIGKTARPGENRIDVKVANLWVNRLIGDLQPGATKVTFTTIPTYRPDAPLRPSGLIGPVRLLRQRN